MCADPDNLPYSNEAQEGFENRLAELIAGEMKAALRYTWMPQRRGYVRRTLKARTCDLLMGAPAGLERILATRPYCRSTYVFVYPKSRRLQLRSFDDPVLRGLNIGLHKFGDDGANSPPAHALMRRGIVGNIVGFPMWDLDEVDDPQGRIIDAVGSGQIDTAIVWGPFGGFFAGRQRVPLEVVPIADNTDPNQPFAFDISMAVRSGDEALRDELDAIIERRRTDIEKILQQYRVPLAPRVPRAEAATHKEYQ